VEAVRALADHSSIRSQESQLVIDAAARIDMPLGGG
jgi:hypothetical protein